ncbi:hypothetical protein OIV83_003179 [Microbotryomycetes sp. JL201]|nr:hypothetical protein OIV83_003179 [Microbotryomycetes sp. JL201]
MVSPALHLCDDLLRAKDELQGLLGIIDKESPTDQDVATLATFRAELLAIREAVSTGSLPRLFFSTPYSSVDRADVDTCLAHSLLDTVKGDDPLSSLARDRILQLPLYDAVIVVAVGHGLEGLHFRK